MTHYLLAWTIRICPNPIAPEIADSSPFNVGGKEAPLREMQKSVNNRCAQYVLFAKRRSVTPEKSR
jgi:hypothetical protein